MFEFLFGGKNPTKAWQRSPDLRLDFDLRDGMLNGIRLGQPLSCLSFLGPIEDRTGLRQNEYRYFSLGLSIGCYNTDALVDCFELVVQDAECPKYHPYAGRCRYQDRDIPLQKMDEHSFVATFGQPYWRDKDDEEIILFYEWPSREWQVEFTLDCRLNRIIVTSDPLMADSRQRKAYGVSKAWPPEWREG